MNVMLERICQCTFSFTVLQPTRLSRERVPSVRSAVARIFAHITSIYLCILRIPVAADVIGFPLDLSFHKLQRRGPTREIKVKPRNRTC